METEILDINGMWAKLLDENRQRGGRVHLQESECAHRGGVRLMLPVSLRGTPEHQWECADCGAQLTNEDVKKVVALFGSHTVKRERFED